MKVKRNGTIQTFSLNWHDEFEIESVEPDHINVTVIPGRADPDCDPTDRILVVSDRPYSPTDCIGFDANGAWVFELSSKKDGVYLYEIFR